MIEEAKTKRDEIIKDLTREETKIKSNIEKTLTDYQNILKKQENFLSSELERIVKEQEEAKPKAEREQEEKELQKQISNLTEGRIQKND